MKRFRVSVLSVMAAAALLLTACAKAPEQAQTPQETRTVTDMRGREIALGGAPVTRVIGLTPSDCEILYALGAQDALVGRGEYCDYPAAVVSIPAVQSNYELNTEQILALAPQVLFVSDMEPSDERLQALEAAGIAVVMTNAHYEIDAVYQGIALIGDVMQREAEADAVIAQMQAAFDALAKKAVQQGEKKTVYFEVSPLEYGLWTAGAGTFMDEIAKMIGAKNVFSDVEGWSEISEEQVLLRNPDVIVTIGMYDGEGLTPAEEILSRTGWENVTAVKNGAVFNLPDNELSRPVPRLADGARMLYDFVYGNDAA